MLEAIEKLLILQDRDRKISRVQGEMNNLGPERAAIQAKITSVQTALDDAKLEQKQIETERKRLELDAEAKKQQIDKYSIQQFQTKKNDEYKALGNEIQSCKAVIFDLENQQIELMERAEAAQKVVNEASQVASTAKKALDGQLSDLATREISLKKQLADLQSDYASLTGALDEDILNRYLRLRKQKGDNTLVGVEHSTCGGCHMRLPMQTVVSCQGNQDLVTCPNCGRILYYTPHMNLVAPD